MKKIITIVLSVAVLLCAGVLAAKTIRITEFSKTTATKTISVGSFNKIESSRINVICVMGTSSGTATLSAPENIIDMIEVSVKGGKLNVEIDDDVQFSEFLKKNLKATLTVRTSSLKGVDAKLGSVVEVRGAVKSDSKLDFEASTGGKVLLGSVTTDNDCDLEATTGGTVSIQNLAAVEADMESSTGASIKVGKAMLDELIVNVTTGAGVLVRDGRASRASFDASTAGVADVKDIKVATATANASTGGAVKCNVSNLTNSVSSTGGSVSNDR